MTADVSVDRLGVSVKVKVVDSWWVVLVTTRSAPRHRVPRQCGTAHSTDTSRGKRTWPPTSLAIPDLPSNRYAEIAVRVRGLCTRFGLPYTTGSILRQYLQTLRTIHALALPDRGTRAAPGSAVPAVQGERKMVGLDAVA